MKSNSTNERKFFDDLNNFNIKEQFKSLRFEKEIFNTNCLVMKTIGINSSIGNVKYIKIFLYIVSNEWEKALFQLKDQNMKEKYFEVLIIF